MQIYSKSDDSAKEPPVNFDSKAPKYDSFEDTPASHALERAERNLLASLCNSNQSRVHKELNMLESSLNRQRTRWACITAKSQREKNYPTKNGIMYEVNTFYQMTEVKPLYERSGGASPPDREGEVIHRFTHRSRQRMMNRARRLNPEYMQIEGERIKKKLPTPYFVTLTYHKNWQDCRAAKKHLNAFHQRWRRRGKDYAYFWKMEPQKRGAVHFHLAMFLPESWREKSIEKIRERIQNDWAEVTKWVDGYDVPFTRFDYLRKRKKKTEKYRVKGCERSVETLCKNPRVEYKVEPDFEHRFYGTNVRKCDNWKMFLGYMYKYMEKEIRENPWDGQETGRFWGFSNNLDFQAIQAGCVDHAELEQLNDFCNALNVLTFSSLVTHLTQNAERAKKELTGKALQGKLKRYRNTFKAQKRRFVINREKIKAGYMLQFELKAKKALKVRKYLNEKKIDEIFSDLNKNIYNALE